MAKKILLVDDEKDILLVMGKRIEGWGYDLSTASSGKDALELIKENIFDLAIIDFMMPDMDGVTLLKKIREKNKEIPVIMFTAYPTSDTIKGAEHLGVNAFIPKLSVHANIEKMLEEAIRINIKQEK